MGVVLLASSPAVAGNHDEDTNTKVWICKYTHTPEIGEEAQTVNSVDFNQNRIVGEWGFEDEHGSTYVYGYSVGPDAVEKPDTADDCPPYDPEKITALLTSPDVDPSVCVLGVPTEADVTWPEDGGGIDYDVDDATSTVTATINLATHIWGAVPSGWSVDGATATYVVDPADLADATCTRDTAVPTSPVVNPSVCVQGEPTTATITWPTDVTGIDYDVDETTRTVTATIDLQDYQWGTLPIGWSVDGAVASYTVRAGDLQNATCQAPTKDPTVNSFSEDRTSCAGGVERRSGSTTTTYSWNRQTKSFDSQTSAVSWGGWTFVRSLTNDEFEQLGCRPDQPAPVEILGSETRVSCAGVEERGSTQVTTFEWNEATRDYNEVVGATVWADWAKVRDLTDEELLAEGCIAGEETVVPKPKPTIKGVERVAPPAAVPTAVAAGVGGATPTTMTQLLAQMLMGGGMLLLLAGGWVGFGRREGGAHEA